MLQTKFEEKCILTCTETSVTHLSEIDNFKENFFIKVVIEGMVVNLKYNNRGLYIGEKFGMEFTTIGPKKYTVNRN